jgi:hypothetical protein
VGEDNPEPLDPIGPLADPVTRAGRLQAELLILLVPTPSATAGWSLMAMNSAVCHQVVRLASARRKSSHISNARSQATHPMGAIPQPVSLPQVASPKRTFYVQIPPDISRAPTGRVQRIDTMFSRQLYSAQLRVRAERHIQGRKVRCKSEISRGPRHWQ